jgi:hypothetical protein|tara:strand:- start:5338 stop:5673 length:336 start_codon:yes stop_codon:yes gene_type:complete
VSSGDIVIIERDGTMRAIVDDVGDLFDGARSVTVRRASHVVPVGRVRGIVYRAIRSVISDHGRMAGWTRCWSGPWLVDLSLVGGPSVLGVYATRRVALDAERAWLVEKGWA